MTWDIKAGLMCCSSFCKQSGSHTSTYMQSNATQPLTFSRSFLTPHSPSTPAHWPAVQPLAGVRKLVCRLHAHNILIAVATASQRCNFLLKTAHLHNIFGLFSDRIASLGAFRMVRTLPGIRTSERAELYNGAHPRWRLASSAVEGWNFGRGGPGVLSFVESERSLRTVTAWASARAIL
ncbi:hypothetical protein EDD17DRAFT_778527 [Pisolithus thermaeus]|nr:hypothetical protein EDD17DRAFT_778527 [Pisolithus thermaeus]